MAKARSAALKHTPSPAHTKLRVFGNKPFMRFARKFGASQAELWEASQEEPDANLGGGVFKLRLARKGEGSSGGARLIVAMKKGNRMVMMFGFEKKDRANIDAEELKSFKKLAKTYLALSEKDMDSLVKIGELTEIKPSPAKH